MYGFIIVTGGDPRPGNRGGGWCRVGHLWSRDLLATLQRAYDETMTEEGEMEEPPAELDLP
jgi:hypothetical protein